MSTPNITPIADGCFRDRSRLILNEAGVPCWLEYTPILNPESAANRAVCSKLVIDCTLAGGGWQMTSLQEEVSIRDYTRYAPASSIPGDPGSGYVHTRTDEVSPPSASVWAVYLYHGYVYVVAPGHSGFVRGGRLAPASQDELDAFLGRANAE